MMHSWIMEQSVSCSTVPAPLAPFPSCVWKFVEAAIHRHGLIYSLLIDTLLSLPQSFSILFLDTRLHRRNAECLLTVAVTMTSEDYSAITS